MAQRRGARTLPVSVAVDKVARKALVSEGRRRGLGLSPTIRTLAFERLVELSEERQLTRARRWQEQRMRELYERIRAGRVSESSGAEIEAIFEDALADHAEERPARRRRR